MLKVAKGGGTTVANAERLGGFVDLVISDPDIKAVVLSGPGREKDEEKLTDLLIGAAKNKEFRERNVRLVRDRFIPIYASAGIPIAVLDKKLGGLDRRLKAYDSSQKTKRDLSPCEMFAEYLIAEPAAAIAIRKGKKAAALYPENIGMVMDMDKGRVKQSSYPVMRRHIRGALDKNDIVFIPGFYAVDENGNIITSDRGGSDITGSDVSVALEADLYENFTDVIKIFSCDPDIVGRDKIKANDQISFIEIIEMSYMGARVIHHSAVEVCMKADIPVRVRSSFKPENKGTLISSQTEMNKFKGVTYKTDFHMIDIFDPRMIGKAGYAADILQVLKEHGVPFEHITTSIASISFAINKKDLPAGYDADDVVKEINEKLNPYRVSNKNYDAMVCLVGEGMKNTYGVMARASIAMARDKLNINTIYQGPSESNIILGVSNKYALEAVNVLHTEFFNKPRTRRVFDWVSMRI